ncbi:MAG: class I SAM-dependent methyltransferase, partial [Planctomycetes bacterium]|nr:class I SAM-dependent methyltransferase [Planctomycetota bacterium]
MIGGSFGGRKMLLMLVICGLSLFCADRAAGADSEAQRILDATGVKGGLVVHIGCGDGRLTAALRANDSYVVHGLDADSGNVAIARRYIHSQGLYGKVSVEEFAAAGLPYADDLVNLIVSEGLGVVAMDEVMRVLAPNGVAYVRQGRRWTKTVKAWPDEIDEWTHYLH